MLVENKYGNFLGKITQNYLKITRLLPCLTRSYLKITQKLPFKNTMPEAKNTGNHYLYNQICPHGWGIYIGKLQ